MLVGGNKRRVANGCVLLVFQKLCINLIVIRVHKGFELQRAWMPMVYTQQVLATLCQFSTGNGRAS